MGFNGVFLMTPGYATSPRTTGKLEEVINWRKQRVRHCFVAVQVPIAVPPLWLTNANVPLTVEPPRVPFNVNILLLVTPGRTAVPVTFGPDTVNCTANGVPAALGEVQGGPPVGPKQQVEGGPAVT
jgi:hypothetical protein